MVKVLVATEERQGDRHDDFAWAVEGELVYVPVDECDCPKCGCGRGFAGMASGRATTTVLVVERQDLTPADLFNALSDSLERQGQLSGDWTPEDETMFRRLFQRLFVAAAHFPTGSIVERDGHHLRRRAQTEPIDLPSDVSVVDDQA